MAFSIFFSFILFFVYKKKGSELFLFLTIQNLTSYVEFQFQL